MSQPLWVRLYLVPQTENLNSMPPYVVGLMTGESGSHYILNPMLELVENPETFEEEYDQIGMNFVNKTYVWRCQVLEHKPEIGSIRNASSEDYELGELG